MHAMRLRLGDDRGATLMELVVGMMIMMIFMGMFTGAIVLLYQSSSRANALTIGASQTDQAFSRLDKSIRYASAIGSPGINAAGTAWYVEFMTNVTPNVGNLAVVIPTCTQLRITTVTMTSGAPAQTTLAQQLQARTWLPSSTGATYTNLTGWVPWANGISNGTSVSQPFTLGFTGSSPSLERLTVNLVATSGSPAVPAQINSTFTALNSATAAGAAGGVGTNASSGCGQVTRP